MTKLGIIPISDIIHIQKKRIGQNENNMIPNHDDDDLYNTL